MDNFIKIQKKALFSESDIKKVLPHVPIYTYEELADKTIDDLYPECIILYQDTKTSGHWTCLNIDENNCINFFDSYGYAPDEELEFSRYNKLYNDKYLTRIIIESGLPVKWNKKRLQIMSDANTCGRFICLRLLMKEISLEKFAKMFLGQQHKPDYYATALTMFIK
jgi:hypothetical protein